MNPAGQMKPAGPINSAPAAQRETMWSTSPSAAEEIADDVDEPREVRATRHLDDGDPREQLGEAGSPFDRLLGAAGPERRAAEVERAEVLVVEGKVRQALGGLDASRAQALAVAPPLEQHEALE